jgi:hypothetical protein
MKPIRKLQPPSVKLSLHVETVRILSSDMLNLVRGAGGSDQTFSDPTKVGVGCKNQ